MMEEDALDSAPPASPAPPPPPASPAPPPPARPRGFLGWLGDRLPYIVVMIMAVLGVAYTSMSGRPLYGYWEFLAIAIGLACIAIGWRQTSDPAARRRLVVTQSLHWLAFLIAMTILLLPGVNTFLNGPATGLALMLLLALGTFVAGVHVSADIAVLGIALALTVPAMAWLKQSALMLVLIGLVIGALMVVFRPRNNQA
jgi:predicted lipid-binding transport protein (Tim44 family)